VVDQRPTHVRWQILAILSLVMVVTALGRLNLGIAARFMQEEFKFTTETMGLILGAFAFGRRRGRQSTACLGMTCSAFLLLAGSHALNNISAVLLLAAAGGFSNFAAPSWWATCIEMTPNYSGSLSGLMNKCANIAGGIAPVVTARIATRLGWSQALDFAAIVSLTGHHLALREC
jgi:sugar phosphate permease